VCAHVYAKYYSEAHRLNQKKKKVKNVKKATKRRVDSLTAH
jgi:hypothetical protein